jgi:hypothetical protein
MSEKQRLVEAQRGLTIARRVLEKIGHGHSRNPENDALEALDEMRRAGPKQSLAVIVGHERAAR